MCMEDDKNVWRLMKSGWQNDGSGWQNDDSKWNWHAKGLREGSKWIKKNWMIKGRRKKHVHESRWIYEWEWHVYKLHKNLNTAPHTQKWLCFIY